MNSFERFKQKNTIRAKSVDKGNATFIFKGYNSTKMICGKNEVQAAIVNQQEKDSAYIYTQLNSPIDIGSVWEAKTLHFLITEEIITIKDVEWHKYAAQLCNIQVEGHWGRFIGPEKSYVNVAIKQNVLLTSLQKPILILAAGIVDIGHKVVIGKRAWMIQESDLISTPGIGYYSLTPTTISKDKEYEIPNNTNYGVGAVENNVNIQLSTEDGYFKYNNPNIQIVKRSADQVIFYLPFGVNEVTIETKKEGEVVQTTYRVQ